jgi:hypothetical protein
MFLLLLCGGCTWLCHYTATGQVVVPANATTPVKPPLDEVVATAIHPLGFSDGRMVHIPGGPLGRYKSEPDRDYVDFEFGVTYKSFFPPKNQVLVRTEPMTGKAFISDLRNDATQTEPAFIKSVREAIERQLKSAYGNTTVIRKEKVTSRQCIQDSWP